MAQLNLNIPYIHAYVSSEFLYKGSIPEGTPKKEPCTIFAIKTVHNRALTFWIHLTNGAIFAGVPISVLTWKEDAEELDLNELQVWNSESNDAAVTTFTYLQNTRVGLKTRKGNIHYGHYMFTVDNYNGDHNYNQDAHADLPDAKQFHLIKLDNGCFAAYPHYKCVFFNPDIVKEPYDLNNPPKYRVNFELFDVESSKSIQSYTAGHDENTLYQFKQIK